MRLRIKFSKNGFHEIYRASGYYALFSESAAAGRDRCGVFRRIQSAYADVLCPAPGTGSHQQRGIFDLDVNSCGTTAEIREKLNAQMVPEIQVLQVVKIPEDRASKGMTLVAAADYLVRFRDPSLLPEHWREELQKFLGQEQIFVIKSGKKWRKRMGYQAVPVSDGGAGRRPVSPVICRQPE